MLGISTHEGNDKIVLGDVTLADGDINIPAASVNISGGSGNDTMTFGKITSSNGYTFFATGGTGQDTYQFQASGFNAEISEEGKESDTVEFFGVDSSKISSITQLTNTLQFKLESDMYGSNFKTLSIQGIDGTTDGTNVLRFSQADFEGDKMNLYTGKGTGKLLGGSIDLASIVTHLSSTSDWTKLTFAQSGTSITATGKA